MNKKNIINYILANYEKDSKFNNEIIISIRQTVKEMEVAESIFNFVDDPTLIEAAIYREDAAKRKFEYLLAMAKEKNM